MDCSNEEIAVRSHDIIVASGPARASEYDNLANIGAAVRIAINLRGVPPVPFPLLKDVAVHRLGLQAPEVRPAIELLAEAEMVVLHTEGRNIKTIVPDIPYFADLYSTIGEVGMQTGLNEHEELTITIMKRLNLSPVTNDALVSLGPEKQALKRVLDIGNDAGFIVSKRARGKTIFLSPGYFAEDPQALADLTALAGNSKLSQTLNLLKKHQGYPLSKIVTEREIVGCKLDDEEINIIKILAGDGFIPPPSIKTDHSGEHHFIFGPRPGNTRLQPHEVQIYLNAIALVAAVRQGQFLAKEYAIRYPSLLLKAFKEKKYLTSNSEASEQYKAIVQAGVAKLEKTTASKASLRLIDNPDNIRSLDMAIELVSGNTGHPCPDEELILALRQGERYVEPLLSRKTLANYNIIQTDQLSQAAFDNFLLRGVR